MYIFIGLNIIKLLIGIATVYLTFNYIHLEQDFLIGILTMGIGGFILIRSFSFFILLGILKLILKKENKQISFIAYKYTGLFAFYILTNFFLMSFYFWNKWIGLIILILFLILGVLM